MLNQFVATLLFTTYFSSFSQAHASDEMAIDPNPYPAQKRACENPSSPSPKRVKYTKEAANKVLQLTAKLSLEEWQNILIYIDDFTDLAQLTQGTYCLVPTLAQLDILKISQNHRAPFLLKLSIIAAADTLNEQRGWQLPFNPLLSYQHNRAMTCLMETYADKDHYNQLKNSKRLHSFISSLTDQLIPQTPESDYFNLPEDISDNIQQLQKAAAGKNKKSREFVAWLYKYGQEAEITQPLLKDDYLLNAIEAVQLHSLPNEDIYYNTQALFTYFIWERPHLCEKIIIECWRRHYPSLIINLLNQFPSNVNFLEAMKKTIQRLPVFSTFHSLPLKEFLTLIETRTNKNLLITSPTSILRTGLTPEEQKKNKESLLGFVNSLLLKLELLENPYEGMNLQTAIHKAATLHSSYKLTPVAKDAFKKILKNTSEEKIATYFQEELATHAERLLSLEKSPYLTFPIGKFITYLWKEVHPVSPLSDKLLSEMCLLSSPLSPFLYNQAQEIYTELEKRELNQKNPTVLQGLKGLFEVSQQEEPLTWSKTILSNPSKSIYQQSTKRKSIYAQIGAWLVKEKITTEALKKGLTEQLPQKAVKPIIF